MKRIVLLLLILVATSSTYGDCYQECLRRVQGLIRPRYTGTVVIPPEGINIYEPTVIQSAVYVTPHYVPDDTCNCDHFIAELWQHGVEHWLPANKDTTVWRLSEDSIAVHTEAWEPPIWMQLNYTPSNPMPKSSLSSPCAPPPDTVPLTQTSPFTASGWHGLAVGLGVAFFDNTIPKNLWEAVRPECYVVVKLSSNPPTFFLPSVRYASANGIVDGNGHIYVQIAKNAFGIGNLFVGGGIAPLQIATSSGVVNNGTAAINYEIGLTAPWRGKLSWAGSLRYETVGQFDASEKPRTEQPDSILTLTVGIIGLL